MLSMVSRAGLEFILVFLVQSMCLWFVFYGAIGIKARGYKSQSTTPPNTKYQMEPHTVANNLYIPFSINVNISHQV